MINETIAQRVAALRQVMREEHLSSVIIPSTDPHNGEYIPVYWDEDNFKAIEKLATYEDLEEQGLLVRFPVAIGTNVYVVESFLDCIYDYEHCEASQKWKCEEYVQCEYEKKKYYVKETKFTSIMKNYIGKSIFLTREEAEKKLEEMKKNGK